VSVAAITNGEIYFEESGSGELVILMAGLGHGAAYYEKTVPLLAGLGRAIAIDHRVRPDRGGTARPAEADRAPGRDPGPNLRHRRRAGHSDAGIAVAADCRKR
jgi:hypothetical protein